MNKFIIGLLIFTPFLAMAQERLTDINSVARKATSLGTLFVQLAIAFAVLYIIYGVVRYLIATNDPGKRAEGGQIILFGVIGLFVILSIWGLVAILRSSFKTEDNLPSNIKNGTLELIPKLDGGTSGSGTGGGSGLYKGRY